MYLAWLKPNELVKGTQKISVTFLSKIILKGKEKKTNEIRELGSSLFWKSLVNGGKLFLWMQVCVLCLIKYQKGEEKKNREEKK